MATPNDPVAIPDPSPRGDDDEPTILFITFRQPVMVRVSGQPVPVLAVDAETESDNRGPASNGVLLHTVNLYRIPAERGVGIISGAPIKMRVKLIVMPDNIAGVVQQAPPPPAKK